ncbi:MAG: BREX-2 system adenine-specific DNA-methyltransferase PglX [Bacteroidales bacterium]|nr:BREX-2 system adenine-specific DNA-methyltransferase PglX [Bacteroidales bacterium]
MFAIKTLLPELRKLVGELAEDLLARSTHDAAIHARLREAFQQIERSGRSAQAFEVWREDYLDQVAVAWVLACVFVRFLEDHQLIDECWLAGEGERRRLAEDTHELFFRQHPHDTDREYFQYVFRAVGTIPAAKDLFAEEKNPLWAVAPSGDAAMALLKFWREIDPESGKLKRRFGHERHETHEREDKNNSSFRVFRVFRGPDPTRFLGDLYQELSEKAKKKYALLQTPVFVEEFILDHTLDPALDEFGLSKVRMIDPTCGSGHFLLGGFARLFHLWSQPDHTTGNAERDVQKAFDGIWGVDLNPFAIAIARFRLIVAAVQACEIPRLKLAPGWTIHLAAGDSLLHKQGTGEYESDLFEANPLYGFEEPAVTRAILHQRYHVVVGNPPYITVKDKAQNEAYRRLYSTCHRQYSLGVPFTERFWELAERGEGYIGMITANSFMKREFGKKLIEEFFPKIDLTHVLDTSGAYIPGHGTPTVILFGRAQKPVGATVRAVLGIQGEPSTPEDPAQGLVWQSLVRHIDIANAQDAYTSSADVPRETFAHHPWSIGGGGASDLKDVLEENASITLSEIADSIGITSFTLEDDVYILPSDSVIRHHIGLNEVREMVVGDTLRDWHGSKCDPAIFLYDSNFDPIIDSAAQPVFQYLWPYRTNLSNSKMFGGKTKVQSGLNWYEYGRLTYNKLRTPLSIAFAFVASHNHFVLDRGGKVFNRSAPIIKLPAEATVDDHLALLGLLNSSTACFWMKQTFHNKGDSTDQYGARTTGDPAFNTYEFTGTGLQRLPLPEGRPLKLAKQLDDLAQQYRELLPETTVATATPVAERLKETRTKAEAIHGQMIALQEELDWQCYTLYGLGPRNTRKTRKEDSEEAWFCEDLLRVVEGFPGLSLGERAFEIVLARQMAQGAVQTTWFERHGSTPITEIPSHWPAAYRRLVERRIQLIETHPAIALIEKPEYKRRWNTEPWEVQEQRALRNWLLDRLETPKYRQGTSDHPELTTTARMADVASADPEFQQVAALYRGRPDFDMAALVAELVTAEAVPLLPILRYKPSGLRKRAVWERTWEQQREEDKAGTTKHTNDTKKEQNENENKNKNDDKNDDGDNAFDQDKESDSSFRGSPSKIPVPPKYTAADFLKADYWRLRGKLDVPKERWVSYPHCETEADGSLVVGWAGWNHLEQAAALSSYYDRRKQEGWEARRLAPLLAGLDQLIPWIHQWHPEIDPEFGETAGQSFQTMLEQDTHELGLTLEEVRKWEPPPKARRRRMTNDPRTTTNETD